MISKLKCGMTNSKFIRLLCYISKPKLVLDKIICLLAPVLPDKFLIRIRFRLHVGYRLNLANPKTFNEKIQWLKFNDIHPEYTDLVDKIEAKKYVSNRIGEDYVIPTLGVWKSVDDINWENLPERFVVKSSNDSGGVVVCKDRSSFDVRAAVKKLRKLGGRDYSIINKEYPYKNVPHRFLAEEYIEDESGYELKDYKFFCFNGEPKFLFVATGRQIDDVRFDFFDIHFNHLPILNGHPNADRCPAKPENFDEMLRVAEKLSQGIPHVRVDLYNVKGKIYFGEMTFFHFSGMTPFEPVCWDSRFGEMLKLPAPQAKDI